MDSLRKLRDVFSPSVIVQVALPLGDDREVLPAERDVVRSAVEKRRREFYAGRVAARRALAELDIHDFPLLPDSDRAPIWPERVVGSISHTTEYCVVVVDRAERTRSIGVDVEPNEEIEEKLWASICTEVELERIREAPEEDRGRLARLIFSAKESVYKCQYPLTRMFLSFEEVETEIDRSRHTFRATLPASAGDAIGQRTVEGHWCVDGGFLVTGVELPR